MVQLGVTFVGFLASAIAAVTLTVELTHFLAGFPGLAGSAEPVALVVVTLLLALFTIVFGELVPKSLALAYTEGFALRLSGLIDLVARLAPIHDIGKVGVPDLVLKKPGPLTQEEWVEMRRHPGFGHQVIASAERRAGISNDVLLRLAKEVVYTHHEWWDGTGYPRGLKGEEIPVTGRLVAVVDVYDALVSRRVYKERIPHDEAVRMIVEGRGTHFDPDVVDAVVQVQEEWQQISRALGDMRTDSMHP